jgi:hypothetical protein
LYWVGRNVPAGVAARTTARMSPGTRVLILLDLVGDVLQHPSDVCLTADGQRTRDQGVWPAHGTREVAGRVDAYFGGIAAAGGAVDMVVLDLEDGYSSWGWAMTEARLAAVGADPRFPELAERLGFADARLALPDRGRAGEHLRWNAVMAAVVSTALDRAAYDPLRRHFPRAGMCNFDNVAMARERVVPDLNGHPQYTLGDPPGTHQSPAYYGLWSPPTVAADWRRPFVRGGVRGQLRPGDGRVVPQAGAAVGRVQELRGRGRAGDPVGRDGLLGRGGVARDARRGDGQRAVLQPGRAPAAGRPAAPRGDGGRRRRAGGGAGRPRAAGRRAAGRRPGGRPRPSRGTPPTS